MKEYQKLVSALEDLVHAVTSKTLIAEELENAEAVLAEAKKSLDNVHLHCKTFGVYTAPTPGLFQIGDNWEKAVFYMKHRPLDEEMTEEHTLLFGRLESDFEKSFKKINLPEQEK